ncbi:OLC1v1024750C1 [Oldenlandia corymbosa var. corymbosa]|uniref:OLC1v1024750C1 n=1 Tax=Oldenlandia corymbosa var. corymbosa TaxID=529605 RepID=A0AAV1C5B0_OLDCO|nr:OLC1v1024750C1 [Oldenlandia corymbosa var. corymbosa]
MSFLAGRLASTEGAYFLQESKQAVTKIVEKTKPKLPPLSSSNAIQNEVAASSSSSSSADVLPEVLKHSLPPKIFQSSSIPNNSSSFTTSSKWVLHTDPTKTNFVSSDALNPLRAYVSLPQVTLGPKRWQLPNSQHGVLASTANELRQDKYTPVNPEKLKAAAAGISQIGKAFFAATVLVFGGGILSFELAASKLELHSGDDLRAKGHSFVQPRFEMVREKLTPVRTWAEGTSKKWQIEKDNEKVKEKPLIRELSKAFGVKTN